MKNIIKIIKKLDNNDIFWGIVYTVAIIVGTLALVRWWYM